MEMPTLDHYNRQEVAKEIQRIFGPYCSKIVLTFDAHAIQIIAFPKREHSFDVPGGPVMGQAFRDTPYEEL